MRVRRCVDLAYPCEARVGPRERGRDLLKFGQPYRHYLGIAFIDELKSVIFRMCAL